VIALLIFTINVEFLYAVYWCSACLLEEKYTVAEINFTADASSSAIRNIWIEFCKLCNTPESKIEISSWIFIYLLNRVSTFQEILGLSQQATSDRDDVYYCFGGAVLCAMLKSRPI